MPPGTTYWDWLLSDKAAFPIPNDPATGFVDGITGQRITFHQVRDYSIRLASALVNDHSLCPGDVVSICSPNTIWYPLCTLAVMRAGGIPALSSPAYTEDEFVHTIGTVKSRFIMAAPAALPLIGKAGKRLGILESRMFSMEEAVDGFQSIQDMINNYRGPTTPSQPLPAGKTNGQVPGVLCFSSGTTGLPKAVRYCLSYHFYQYNLILRAGHGVASKPHCAMSAGSRHDVPRPQESVSCASILPQ